MSVIKETIGAKRTSAREAVERDPEVQKIGVSYHCEDIPGNMFNRALKRRDCAR